MSKFEYSIKPAELLSEHGISYKSKREWLSIKSCLFCEGGNHDDYFTFVVHKIEGNYICKRSKCGKNGTFWSLLMYFDLNPKKYLTSTVSEKRSSKRFVYGRS